MFPHLMNALEFCHIDGFSVFRGRSGIGAFGLSDICHVGAIVLGPSKIDIELYHGQKSFKLTEFRGPTFHGPQRPRD